ncbi:unnamed protein product [Owenia fusiformis]|uniref:Uncharacterized protein n=1 Tax=Owenia fusiformis TaxID=6347 RepID=A0A8J1Y3V5_OWEFU|nr:unnamed protein product [Owenia fusiformis]
MAQSAEKQVTQFKEEYKTQAEKLVSEVLPKKVIELNDILNLKDFDAARVTDINTDLNIPVPEVVLNNDADGPQPKKRKLDLMDGLSEFPGCRILGLPNGTSPSNKHISSLLDQVKPYIRDLIDHANMIRMWIAFLMPKIEDGNNFGVSIQEDSMSEARQVESEAASYLDQISRYFITRAKIVSKVAKYPHVEDYRRTITELDEKEFVSIRLVVMELRNHYATLHDLIMKNLEKIKKPRSQNTTSMY